VIWSRYQIVDVFSSRPLQGNPVAVFADGSPLSGELMQRTARELNLSETVFLLPAEDPSADLRVRIFTPLAELPFAGHPVLGAAVAVAADRPGPVRLQTGIGVIAVRVRGQAGESAYAELEQVVAAAEPVADQPALLRALGVERSELAVEAYRNGPLHAYVALADAERVAALRPDMAALARLGEGRGFSCFARVGDRVKTRMFAPALGVNEDPATGSAAGPLALHLVRHGWARRGERLEIEQGAEIGRPSRLHASVLERGADGVPEGGARVLVGGAAVIVAEGRYRLD